ncbi:cob(I)yrinic acid a,c-diamide adenosyltransferase [Desulfuromonas acetoxidans]|uniref:corrinoid adenosyltransferase n=1 Tax=Desulfuromonas acetoxidans (strain DSM 684 / 11070) TaxID=281689 RepID=Q1JVQ4_DESA6|nr:cob(I)yrinic acid a,c-diamide adenosyltransferase [Desulfuromonas acetoxidans]EAT14322.1 cob(I)alamin adenosyltransferase [Desulfuromonas acetoxidans DSM 684]MBF0645797.1 cob(I)yrinic acid a,c-diamide adenosyltransferase [Desulfuromonas acetoxidans]NVD24815.1 cob(I)yrinic acid a,c-diamide adenosyltransferase [Desulfuromonas acetoxidans]NVE16860.1 cob(I)yrinic acid a,c-diamide adenosyltransferase [Desulfuromonas acetoxidans]
MANQLKKGLVQIYTGNGKGKTTAALGLAFRAVGRGLRVHIMHFMKLDSDYGEMTSGKKMGPNWSVEQVGRSGFVSFTNPAEEDIELAQQAFCRAVELARSDDYDLLILDELVNALGFRLIRLEQILELIATRAATTELVLTGRNAPQALIDAADLVTEMKDIKHYYDAGQPARIGIES